MAKGRSVGAIMDRPQILPKQNLSPQGEKFGYFPSGNPKNYVFRRAINDRPYTRVEQNLVFQQSEMPPVGGIGYTRSNS